MTARDAFTEGQLGESLRLQAEQVAANPSDSAARLFLFELLTLDGQLNRARDELFAIEQDSPQWPATRVQFLNILKAQAKRRRAAPLLAGNAPRHARLRRQIWRRSRRLSTSSFRKWVDRADEASPYLVGHVDGREFEGLRDLDDRFASVLELFSGADYTWIPFEHLRKIQLLPPAGVLDVAFRPARIWTRDQEYAVILPLLYPESHQAVGDFAVGLDTDLTSQAGVLQGVGARVWMAGEEELPVGECQQFELRLG